jgi:HPt (histidine-containing phosphotransfer) domain-containing protein
MAKIIVTIDADLEDLIPDYLENRRQDCQTVLQKLENGDYEGIRVLGHTMKGTGGGYGFDAITDMGRALEEAAKQPDPAAIRSVVAQLEDYLQAIEIVYR